MNGRLFAQALCSLQGNELRMVHALCCDTGIMDILATKMQDLFHRKTNPFIQKLNEKANALKHRPDEELQLDILLEMAKRLEVRGSHLLTDQEVEEFAGQIVERADQGMAKQDSRYRDYKAKHPGMDPLQTMVRFQLDQLLAQAGKEMDAASPEKQREYLEKVQAFIESMPDEKQDQIKQRLGVEQLTRDVLQKIVVTSGASILFAVIVEVSGFAFYTSAVSLLASLAGLVGVTLSFGTYTVLTSTVAILANPLFLVMLLGGGGFYLYRAQTRKFQNKMVPILILQIALPALGAFRQPVSYSPLQGRWQAAFEQHWKLRAEMGEHQQHVDEYIRQIAACKEEIRRAEQRIAERERHIARTHSEVKRRLEKANLAQLGISEKFDLLAARYEEIGREIERIRQNRQSREYGFLGWAKQKMKSAAAFVETSRLQNQRKELLDKLAGEVISAEQEWGRAEREQIRSARQECQSLRHQLTALQRKRGELETALAQHQTAAARLEQEIGSLEQQFYGLQHV